MKKLSEFKDVEAVTVVAKLMAPVMEIITNKENKKLKDAKNAFEMFSGFFANSPDKMIEVFAILSETPVEEYHCNGVEVAQNIMTLVTDESLLQLFTSQRQKGDATSSGSAVESTEAQ